MIVCPTGRRLARTWPLPGLCRDHGLQHLLRLLPLPQAGPGVPALLLESVSQGVSSSCSRGCLTSPLAA